MNQTAFSVYNASAGSGKTFTLTTEYLIKLFKSNKDDAYKNILAITFTNKAVNEMKSRILNALYGFTEVPFLEKSQDLLPFIQKDNPELTDVFIREKSKKIIKHLLHEYASFDVLTIDKFTHKLIRSFAQNLEFSENFEVIINQDDLINQAIARVMAKVGEDQLLTDVVLDFAKDKNDEDKSWDISFDLKNIAHQLTKEAFKKDIDQLKNIHLEDYVIIKKDLLQKKIYIQKEIKIIAESILENFSDLGIIKESFDRGNYFNFFITNLENPLANQGLLEKARAGLFYKKSARKDQQQLIDSISSNIRDAVEKINELANNHKLCSYTIKNITPISLLQNIYEEMNNIQEEENSKLLSSFNHVIQAEIQNQPALFLYEKLGSKYHHYFIDEFQDTSKLQWENLKPLIDNALSGEYAPGQNGTLMIVGDPKQAIYRFRNGDAEQFINLSADKINPFSNPNKKTTALDTNWRSFKEVIDFNNDFFKYISHQFNHDLYKNLYEKESHQNSNKNIGGYVQIQFLSEDAEDDENTFEETTDETIKNGHQYFKMVLKTIRDLEELGYKHKDIAILVNKNAQGNYIAQQLIANNIKIISPDALRLTNSPEVMCVISLLKYMLDPHHLEEKVNFLILLKSTLKENIEWTTDEQAILTSKSLKDLSQYLLSKNIHLALDHLLNQSLFDSVEKIIKNLFPQSQSNGYLQYFLDLVYEKNIKEQIGLNDFLTLWDEKVSSFLVPTPSDIDAVQIMSIHKSKGLEFPVVIYPFATERISYRLSKEEFFIENPLADITLPVLLMKATSDISNYGEAFAEIYNHKQEQVMLDIINIQYVALTRAVEHLYIFTEAKFRNEKGEKILTDTETGNFFAAYVQSKGKELTTFELGKKIKYRAVEEEDSKEELLPTINQTINENAIKIAQNEALLWDTKKQEARAFGNILHQLMQEVNQFDDIEKTIQKNLAKGVFEPQDEDLFTSKLNEIVNHPKLIKFFNPAYQKMNERALINHLGEVLIPDKIVFHSAKKVSILDYKTGEKSTIHLNQINHYADALSQMGYQVLEKLIVYVGETLKVEKV